MKDFFNNSLCILNNKLDSGGAEKNCVVICNELANNNINVELWITKLDKSPLIKLLDKRVKVTSIPGKKVRYTILQLKKLMVSSKLEIMLVFNMELLIPAYLINSFYHLNIKIVARSISTLSLNYNQNGFLGRIIWLKLISYSLNRIDTIIAQSFGMKDDLIKNLHIIESKIVVIPNPAFNFTINKKQERRDFINHQEILFVGRLTEAKGLNYLLEIFLVALKSLPELHLTIVGTGELQQEFQEKTLKLGLSKSIRFEGYQTDLSDYYQNAKATVLTSIREGFPNVLIESISFGTPVISFDCPSGPRDIIIPNVNGILVEHLNVQKFSKAIVGVINKNIKFDKEKIIESSKRFSLEKIIRQYEKILFE
ncbi:MAG: glycosyltransferase [Bacteroidota bacterium]|nr:glycosyltransferase [Bacteroidota bacterium]